MHSLIRLRGGLVVGAASVLHVCSNDQIPKEFARTLPPAIDRSLDRSIVRDGETTIKIKLSLLRGGGLGDREETRPKCCFFFSWEKPRQ